MNSTTNLLDRYLQAVGEHLPSAAHDDVLAELRANLQAQIDDRAEELNRPLTHAEVAAILRDHGRPVLVAARYSQQQYLIGPTIFPYYLMTLRKALPIVLIVCFLAQCTRLFFVHTLPELFAGIGTAIGQLIPNLVFFLFWFTLAFAVAEYVFTHNPTHNLGASWDPTRLPRLKTQLQGKSRASRVADLVFHCLWILYVLAIPSHPVLILGPGDIMLRAFPIAFAPAWRNFYILLLVLLGVQLVAKILALVSTYDPLQPVFELITKLCGVVSAAYLVSMKTYFVATAPTANQLAIANINYWAGFSFRIVLVITVLATIAEIWKIVRPNLRTQTVALF